MTGNLPKHTDSVLNCRFAPLFLCGCLALLLASQWARGQAESATLLGTVRLEDGAPAGNVEITIRRPDTNETYSLLTGSGGNYRRDSLAAGAYEIQVAARGHAGLLRVGVQLLVGQVLREDFVLIPGDENEVRVQESGWVPSGSDRDDRGLVIDREKLETLPVASRDIGQLVDMAPGASRTSSGRRRGVKVMGMRRRDNLLYIDGTLFTHGDGGTTFQASTDALQEFDIKSGLYSAEYGIRPGAQIVAVTKSGTNAYHGSLYWFHRNDNLDARNFFEQEKKEFKRNQMGATLGGPILLPGLFKGTDRAWFFLSHQYRSIRETRPLTGVVPTRDEKKGLFSSPIPDPSTGAPFPNNRIPENRFDPVALKLLPIWPDPNTVGPLNFTSPDSVSPTDNPQIIARVDLKTSDVSRWSGRFVWDSRPITSARAVSIFSSTSPLATYGQSISYSRNLGSRDINVASIHLFRRPYESVPSNPLPNLAGRLGIDELLLAEVDRHGVPRTRITGFAGIGDQTLAGRAALGNWQVKDDLVLPRGNHTLKLGLEYRQHFNQYGQHRRSEFDFYNRYTGNGWGDFLLGHLAQSQLGGEINRGRFHQNSIYAYLSDEWRVTPGLDLNLGLRYELRLPWVDLRGFMANFDPATGRLHPELLDLDLAPGETGRFRPRMPLIQWNRLGGIQPRLGLALRLGERTVLHTGAGLYSNEPDVGMVSRLGRNPRPGAERLIFESDLETPLLSLSDPFPETGRAAAVPDHYGVETPLPLATTQSWGLSLQHRLFRELMINAGYHGSHTIHRVETVSLNDAAPGTGDRQQRRPFSDLQNVQMPQADGGAWYHGLQLQVEKAPGAHGLSLLASFSWSRLIEIGASDVGSHHPTFFRSRNMDLEATRGLADFHVPRRLLMSVGYELPFGSDGTLSRPEWISNLVRNWSLRVISSAQDGPWITINLPGDPLDVGSVASQWPDRIRDANLPESRRVPTRWFDTEAFRLPRAFHYGDAGKSTVEGPGLINLDVSLRRSFRLEEERRIELRLEVFNAANRANFAVGRSDPAIEFGTTGFGSIGRALPGRQIQLGFKAYF